MKRPVKVVPRPKKGTKTPKRAAFLAAYEELGNVYRAAKASGFQREYHYRLLKSDPAYAAAFENAMGRAFKVQCEMATASEAFIRGMIRALREEARRLTKLLPLDKRHPSARWQAYYKARPQKLKKKPKK